MACVIDPQVVVPSRSDIKQICLASGDQQGYRSSDRGERVMFEHVTGGGIRMIHLGYPVRTEVTRSLWSERSAACKFGLRPERG